MDATGASFGTSKGQIAAYIDNIRQLHGVNTETSTEMIELFARQRDIGTGSYVALGQAAAGYARVTGSDVPKATEELISALDGGYDSISKLDQRFSFLSTAQAQAIHDFDASGQKAQAFAVAIRDNIALLQRQQRELNNRVGSGQMQDLRDQLEQELVARRLVGEQQKQYELQYWQQHLDQVQTGSKAELQIRKQIAADQHELDTKSLVDEWQNFSETMRLKIEASKSNVAQQIALAEQWVEKGQSLYGDDIKNYKSALDEKTRLLQQQIANDRKIREIALASRAEIAKIDLAGAPAPKGKGSIIDSLFGDVSGEGAKADLDRRMDALKAEFVAKQAEFNDVINDSNSTPVQIAEAQSKLAAATQQYAVDATNLNKQAAQQVTQAWENAFAPIEHAFDSSIEGMLRGTQTLQDGMRKLAQSMVLSFIQSGIKQAFSGLASQLSSLTAPVFGRGGALPGVGSALGIGGGAAGIGGQVTQTTALTANTTALTSLTAALSGHTAVTTANTTAMTAGTAATTGNTASQTTNLVGNTVQTTANTSAIAANTAAVSSESASSGGGIFGSLMSFLPAFDVGTNNVPRDMLAQIHQGEIIVPAAQAANIRSGQSMLGYGSSKSMALPKGAAENMKFANSNEPPNGVGGNTYNSKTSGDTNFHYSPTINGNSNVDLNDILTQQGSTMRRWLNNQARNGSFKT